MVTSPYSAQPENHPDHSNSRSAQGTHPPMVYRPEHPHQPYTPGGSAPPRQHRSPTAPSERPSSHAVATPSPETSAKTFLRTEHVPGKGTEYVYNNGARLPTHDIDGERVNPAWGMTKANKARKRLAQACIECREKKIKCEPGRGDECANCEKYKRRCQK